MVGGDAMLGIYHKRDKKYSEKAFIYKAIRDDNGRVLRHEEQSSMGFRCQDLGFTTATNKNAGRIEKVVTGAIESIDLKDGDVMPDDLIQYGSTKYIVIDILFEDDTESKMLRNNVWGKTTIKLRG